MLYLGFDCCHSDHTCFVHHRFVGRCVLSVHVDDIIITRDNASSIIKVKQTFDRVFDVKDLGYLRYFLGIEVTRSHHGISLSQHKYTLDLLKDICMLGYCLASSPIELNLKLSVELGELLPDVFVYQCLMGQLIYLTKLAQQSVVSQFMHAPRTSHLDAVYHILRYLKTCPGLGLLYIAGVQSRVSCFTHVDYEGSKDDRKSTSGFCTFYSNHLLSWKNKKQAVVSCSLTEVEYRAMA